VLLEGREVEAPEVPGGAEAAEGPEEGPLETTDIVHLKPAQTVLPPLVLRITLG